MARLQLPCLPCTLQPASIRHFEQALALHCVSCPLALIPVTVAEGVSAPATALVLVPVTSVDSAILVCAGPLPMPEVSIGTLTKLPVSKLPINLAQGSNDAVKCTHCFGAAVSDMVIVVLRAPLYASRTGLPNLLSNWLRMQNKGYPWVLSSSHSPSYLTGKDCPSVSAAAGVRLNVACPLPCLLSYCHCPV